MMSSLLPAACACVMFALLQHTVLPAACVRVMIAILQHMGVLGFV